MSFLHIPAYTTTQPDTFTDEATGRTFEVTQDLDAEDPRGWIEPEHAALWAYGQPTLKNSVVAHKPQGNIAIDAFEEFSRYFGESEALELTRRWLRIFHPNSRIQVDTATIRGYSQGDWLDVVAAVEEGYGTPADHLEQLRQWAWGDVWVVSEQHGSSLGGIYANSAEDAVKAYLADHDPKVTEQRTITLTVTADSKADIEAKVDEVLEAIATSDALPTGIVASAAPKDIDPDWLDDIADVLQTDHVDVSWRARNERGRVIFDSDVTLTPTQAAGMFRGIGENS